MNLQRTPVRSRKPAHSTRLALQPLEDRCTPATFSYAEATQTLTVFAANHDEILVEGNAADPAGYLTVKESADPFFNSADDTQPVRNLVVRFDGVDFGELYLRASLHLSGNATVFGARESQYISHRGTIGGNFRYTAFGDANDEVDFFGGSGVGAKAILNLGAGSNMLRLMGGGVGGDLMVKAGKGNDHVELASGDNVAVGGSATFRLGNGTNMIEGMSNGDVYVGKKFTYVGGDGVDFVNLRASTTDLIVVGSASFVLEGLNPGAHNALEFDGVTVGGQLNIVGGMDNDVVEFAEDLSVGGNLRADLRDGTNTFAIGHVGATTNAIAGSLRYAGGPGTDLVGVDATTIGKNARFALGAAGALAQSLRIGFVHPDGVQVNGAMNVTSGSGQDNFHFTRLYVGKDLMLASGAGNDKVYLDDTDIAGKTGLGFGAGNDRLYVEMLTSDALGNPLDSDATFGGTFTVRAGDGNDYVNLSDDSLIATIARFGAKVSLFGGDGADTLLHAGNEFMVSGNFADFETGALP